MTALDAGRSWDVKVDRSTCIGSGVCVGIAPDSFRLEGGRAQPARQHGVPEDQAVLAAAVTCPALAIEVRLAGSDIVIAPEQAADD